MSVTKATINRLQSHPFKTGVLDLLRSHFDESIVKRFMLTFEAERYDVGNTHNQLKDNNLIMEVAYVHPNGLFTYICDIYSWMTREQTEYKLLKYIQDKCVAGELGKDWGDKKGKISEDVKSGKHQTKEIIHTT